MYSVYMYIVYMRRHTAEHAKGRMCVHLKIFSRILLSRFICMYSFSFFLFPFCFLHFCALTRALFTLCSLFLTHSLTCAPSLLHAHTQTHAEGETD